MHDYLGAFLIVLLFLPSSLLVFFRFSNYKTILLHASLDDNALTSVFKLVIFAPIESIILLYTLLFMIDAVRYLWTGTYSSM